MYHTAVYLLAVLLHESGRQPVAEGKTLAHALKSPQVRPFAEWPDLPADVQNGRRMTARGLLELFHIGEPFPDFGTDPVSDRDLAEAIHESERKAVEAGTVVVKLNRPWTPFADLPPEAQEGRLMQARYLKARAFFAPRQVAAEGKGDLFPGADCDRDTLKPGDTGSFSVEASDSGETPAA